MKKDCLFLDVFTDTPYTGNQLAVFPLADDLSGVQMQRLANEINYSETVFILESHDPKADYTIRIFTPKAEMPFAGHPTLGAAYALLNVLDNECKNRDKIRLGTKVGVIPLERSDGVIWMRQNAPEFFETFHELNEIAELVGLERADISEELPVEEVSTGNVMLLIPIKGLSAIRKASGHSDKLAKFFGQHESGDPYLFTLETEDPNSKVHTRLFAPHDGIIEDPATGSAAGPLAGYLLKHNVFGRTFEIQNEQGIEMGRPSKILMRGDADEQRVEIGGSCCFVGQATFFI